MRIDFTLTTDDEVEDAEIEVIYWLISQCDAKLYEMQSTGKHTDEFFTALNQISLALQKAVQSLNT